MHEDIDDFEPDMDAYYNMDPEEKRLRKAKYKLYLRYYNGKISYEKYLEELDSDFFEITSIEEDQEIKKYKEKKENEKIIRERQDYDEYLLRKKETEYVWKIVGYLFIFSILFAILFGLLKRFN